MAAEFLNLKSGLMFNDEHGMYPSYLFGYQNDATSFDCKSSSYFGFVLQGELTLTRPAAPPQTLTTGMYFCCPGVLQIKGFGSAMIIERKGFRGLFAIGGPIEEKGRLSYIDNCQTTLLISPPRMGDPCLNLLTFPPQTKQSMHTHPTVRLGVVHSGHGFCVQPGAVRVPLSPGQFFVLGEGTPHCFESLDQGLSVIAYHPDTDWGPTDKLHPMLNRTYLR